MSEILKLQPEALWRNFHLLTQVPRPSGHLEKIQQFLLDWAKERNLEARREAPRTHRHGDAEDARFAPQLRN